MAICLVPRNRCVVPHGRPLENRSLALPLDDLDKSVNISPDGEDFSFRNSMLHLAVFLRRRILHEHKRRHPFRSSHAQPPQSGSKEDGNGGIPPHCRSRMTLSDPTCGAYIGFATSTIPFAACGCSRVWVNLPERGVLLAGSIGVASCYLGWCPTQAPVSGRFCNHEDRVRLRLS